MLLSHLKAWIKNILHSQSWLICAWFICLDKQKVLIDDWLGFLTCVPSPCFRTFLYHRFDYIWMWCHPFNMCRDKDDFLCTSGRRNGSCISSILEHSSRRPRLSSTECRSTTGTEVGWESQFSALKYPNTTMSSCCPACPNLARLPSATAKLE